jgi:NAD+ kinase
MDLEFDALKVVQLKGDGLIVATPTGSTGHSLSAGGPIVHPKLEGLVIAPICPTSMSLRPIVIPHDRQLVVTVETRREIDSPDIGLTIDGQDTVCLKYGDKVKFRRSKRYLHLARTKNKYYKMLRQKLHWGTEI